MIRVSNYLDDRITDFTVVYGPFDTISLQTTVMWSSALAEDEWKVTLGSIFIERSISGSLSSKIVRTV